LLKFSLLFLRNVPRETTEKKWRSFLFVFDKTLDPINGKLSQAGLAWQASEINGWYTKHQNVRKITNKKAKILNTKAYTYTLLI
jgi:hypothetical protein